MSLIKLPRAEASLAHPLEMLLSRRRSIRDYAPGAISLVETSCLLWAAQGITDARGLRTAPSAGALYPLQVYLVAGDVSGIDAGIYRYLPRENALEGLLKGDRRDPMAKAALGQSWLADAALSLVFVARYRRTTGKYGKRGIPYVHIEVGHAAQNVLLTAVALNLGAAVVGAFDDGDVGALLRLSSEETPLYILPVGRSA